MQLSNGTPHGIDIVDDAGNVILSIPSTRVIRCEAKAEQRDPISVGEVNVPTVVTTFGESNLPPQEDGVYWVVSQIVKSAHPDRDDLLVPADLVRDEEGRIIGCRALGR